MAFQSVEEIRLQAERCVAPPRDLHTRRQVRFLLACNEGVELDGCESPADGMKTVRPAARNVQAVGDSDEGIGGCSSAATTDAESADGNEVHRVAYDEAYRKYLQLRREVDTIVNKLKEARLKHAALDAEQPKGTEAMSRTINVTEYFARENKIKQLTDQIASLEKEKVSAEEKLRRSYAAVAHCKVALAPQRSPLDAESRDRVVLLLNRKRDEMRLAISHLRNVQPASAPTPSCSPAPPAFVPAQQSRMHVIAGSPPARTTPSKQVAVDAVPTPSRSAAVAARAGLPVRTRASASPTTATPPHPQTHNPRAVTASFASPMITAMSPTVTPPPPTGVTSASASSSSSSSSFASATVTTATVDALRGIAAPTLSRSRELREMRSRMEVEAPLLHTVARETGLPIEHYIPRAQLRTWVTSSDVTPWEEIITWKEKVVITRPFCVRVSVNSPEELLAASGTTDGLVEGERRTPLPVGRFGVSNHRPYGSTVAYDALKDAAEVCALFASHNRKQARLMSLLGMTVDENGLLRSVYERPCSASVPLYLLQDFILRRQEGFLDSVYSTQAVNRHILLNVASGMKYLHNNVNAIHGRLDTTCIYVWFIPSKAGDGDSPHLTVHATIGSVDGCISLANSRPVPAPINISVLPDDCRQYMAPECLSGAGLLKASDVYSFDMIAYQVYTGQSPFGTPVQRQASSGDLAMSVLRGRRPFIHTSNFTPEVRNFIDRCWHALPSSRPTFENIRKSAFTSCWVGIQPSDACAQHCVSCSASEESVGRLVDGTKTLTTGRTMMPGSRKYISLLVCAGCNGKMREGAAFAVAATLCFAHVGADQYDEESAEYQPHVTWVG